uniref:Uncharacterized protein n=1 Tax=Candidozyma auris TaxID=498019 RepID=A0A0L0P1Z5_CANAR
MTRRELELRLGCLVIGPETIELASDSRSGKLDGDEL